MNDWVSQEALLIEGYRRCAKLTWRYGTTYFWGAALLPRPQRKHVYAVYALCRLADDIVDLPNGQHPGTSRSGGSTNSADIRLDGPPTDPQPASTSSSNPSVRLATFAKSFQTSLAEGGSTDPVMAAVVDTVITRRIDPECFDRFFNAMAMDLTKTSYQTWEDLRNCMEGLGGGDRGDDAARARAHQPSGEGTRTVTRTGVPAHQLPARHRRRS